MKIIFFAVILNILTYMAIWLFGKISGGSDSLQGAFLSVFNWKSLLLIILANSLFGGGVYLYFKETQYAIPIMLALGGVVTFLMSVIFSGASFNIYNVLGIILTLAGVFLMFK